MKKGRKKNLPIDLNISSAFSITFSPTHILEHFDSFLWPFLSILVSWKGFDMVDGTARLIEPLKRQAKLGVVFPATRFSRPVPDDGNYWVLDTDYTNYSIVWSCENFNDKSFRKSTFHSFPILTRISIRLIPYSSLLFLPVCFCYY